MPKNKGEKVVKLIVRKFTFLERMGLRMMKVKPEEIPVAWSAMKDELIINVGFPHDDYVDAWWYFPNLIKAFSHEWVHKVLYEIDGFFACYKFEKIKNLCGLGWVGIFIRGEGEAIIKQKGKEIRRIKVHIDADN